MSYKLLYQYRFWLLYVFDLRKIELVYEISTSYDWNIAYRRGLATDISSWGYKTNIKVFNKLPKRKFLK